MRKRLATLIAAAYLALASTAATPALAGTRRTDDCIAPNGVDINANIGLSAAVVAPFCPKVKAGDSWVRVGFYTAATTWEAMPDGYVPAGATPVEDFAAKFVAIRHVVDAGTPQEFTVEFANGPRLWVGPHPLNPDIVLATPMTLGSIRPLSVGRHTVTTFWIMSAMQCDGWSSVVEESCFPGAGPFPDGTLSFEVVAK